MTEEILLSADHAGYELKEKLEAQLKRMGYSVRDFGTNSAESTDYPDYAHPLAKEISSGHAKRGVMICGTGLGMSYVANRYPNVRAAVVWSPEIAELSRSHNDANVLVLPSRFISDDEAAQILERWLETPFEGGRHERRVLKIDSEMPAVAGGRKRSARSGRRAAGSGKRALKPPGRKPGGKRPARKRGRKK